MTDQPKTCKGRNCTKVKPEDEHSPECLADYHASCGSVNEEVETKLQEAFWRWFSRSCPDHLASYVRDLWMSSPEYAEALGQTKPEMVAVRKEPLDQLLGALVGPPHLIRELQATVGLHHLIKDNPIEQLWEDRRSHGRKGK